ncbi:hypothetical protein ACET3Z_010406 [Daucus carota]
MSSTVQAILRTSKHERDALHSARKKLGDVLSFLRKKGFSEEQVLAELKSDGFCAEMPNRDEFGLPKVHKVDTPIVAQQLPVNSPVSASGFNPLKDKMKGIIQEEAPVQHTLPDVLPAKAELVTRHWVRKDKADSQTSKAPGTEAVVGNSVSNTTVADIADSPITAIPTEAKAPEPANSLDANHSNWQEVKRKKSSTQVDNPSLSAESTLDNKAIANSNANSSIAAHSLPLFSALSRTLSKSQRKKARKSGGKHSPSKH